MIIWESGDWQIYDNGQEIRDKYTGLPCRYKLRKRANAKWRTWRRVTDSVELHDLVKALAMSLTK